MELLQLPDTGISSVGINIACNSGCTINKYLSNTYKLTYILVEY